MSVESARKTIQDSRVICLQHSPEKCLVPQSEHQRTDFKLKTRLLVSGRTAECSDYL